LSAVPFFLKGKIMAAEPINSFGQPTSGIRRVPTTQGTVPAVASRFERQTFVRLPSGAAGRAATAGAAVPVFLARNARQTHVTS